MKWTRREFIRAGSAAAAAGLVGLDGRPLAGAYAAARMHRPFRPLLQDPEARAIAMTALQAASDVGTSYADVRVTSGIGRVTSASGRRIGLRRISGSLNFGVRVLVGGAWGFASSTIFTEEEAARIARLAARQASLNPWSSTEAIELGPAPVVTDGQWETPIDLDPWNYTIQDQLELLLEANELVMKIAESGRSGLQVFSNFNFSKNDVVFASSEGSYTAQRFHGFSGGYTVQVISRDRMNFGSSTPESFRTGGYGWEAIDGIPWADDVEQAVEEAFMQLGAREPDVGRYDVVLSSAAVSSILNSTIVRALEYDRMLGYEMHAGGTSYLGPPEEALGHFSYENPMLNVRATGYVPRAAGAYRWDAEGVAPQDYQLIRNGVLVDYFTSREFSPHLDWWYERNGMPQGPRGTAGSAGSTVTQVVAPSIAILDPGPEDVSEEDMIAATEDGIYFKGGGFASVDPPMLNMQGGGSGLMYEIRDGELGDLLRRPSYLANTLDFWKSMDMIGGEGTFGYHGGGTLKGNPTQLIGRTVGAPAARFRNLNVFTYGRR